MNNDHTDSTRLKHHRLLQPPMLSFWNGCVCISISYFLMTGMLDLDDSIQTISIGALATYAFLFHLITRNAFRAPFHPDIIFTIGHLIQFVIPSIVFATGLFDDLMYPHMQQVKTFFPETIFAVLIAQTLFNLPFCLLRTPTPEIPNITAKRMPIFIILTALGVWASRFLLILTGSYFHYIPGHDFVNTSVLYSPLAIISTLGRIVLIFLCIKMFRKTKRKNTILISTYIIVEIS